MNEINLDYLTAQAGDIKNANAGLANAIDRLSGKPSAEEVSRIIGLANAVCAFADKHWQNLEEYNRQQFLYQLGQEK